MEKFDVKKHWDDFVNNKVVVNCETERLADEFLKYCHEQGMKWYGNISLVNNNAWKTSRENTCYFCEKKIITHGSKRYALGQNYTVTNYQGINKETSIKENIEVIYHNNETIVLIKGDKKYYRGVSKCNPEDTYNREYGFLLAYQRARAKELGV